MLVAAELAERGVDTLVFESAGGISERPRATTLHARTAQCLARRGYSLGAAPPASPPASHAGHPGDTVSAPFHFAGMPGLSITAPASEPHPLVKVPQAALERMFGERACAAGVRLHREHAVTDVRQNSHGVRVRVTGASGTRTRTARYAVGADGARSLVRARAGITSAFFPTTVSALTGLVRLTGPWRPPAGWHPTSRGWLVVKDIPDGMSHVRTVTAARPCEDRHVPVTVEEFGRVAGWIAGRTVEMADPRWLGRFNDFSRLADGYRAGRVFLAGDAAHVHFPIGGQGLSTGLLDALNLGWKLALALRGTAGAGLLDSYDEERRPAARRVIDNTRAQVALMRPDPRLDPVRELIAGLLDSGHGHGYLGAMISAQDTVHPSAGRDSRWQGRFLPNTPVTTPDGPTDVVALLRAGVPLLLLSGTAPEEYAHTARTWEPALRVVRCAEGDLTCPALLLRPDGYIAWTPEDGPLRDVLTRYLGERDGAAARRAGEGYPARPRLSSSNTSGPRPGERSTAASTEASTRLGRR